MEERMLTLDDVQGTFLLLGAGFAIAILAFILEIINYRVRRCWEKRRTKINDEPNLNQVGIYLYIHLYMKGISIGEFL